MTRNGMTNSNGAWTSLGEYQRAEHRAMRTRITGIVMFVLGLAVGVLLMDRAMPASRAAAEQAMLAPHAD